MSDAPTTGTQGSAPQEKTFRSFSREQGANYAQHRRDYHPRLYDILLAHHKSTGGQLGTVLDVGCGPGTATRTLATHFSHAVGIDPSEGMIATARELTAADSATSTGEPIRFEICTIDTLPPELASSLPDGSVDLITAATAAHWFDMPLFWRHAAQLLRPGGTVALWTSGPMLVDPGMPNGREIQAAIDRLEKALDEYMLPPNRLASSLYADLQLPWMLEEPVGEFERASFVRKTWGVGEGAEPMDEFYNVGQQPANVGVLVAVLRTTSPVVRWREANPDAVGTEKDPLKVMRAEIEGLLREVGLDPSAPVIKGGVGGVLLMVKKAEEKIPCN